MPSLKLTQLPATGTVVAADLVYVVTDVAGTPTSNKALVSVLATAVGTLSFPDIVDVAGVSVTIGVTTKFSAVATPTSSDGAALGTTTLMWADLFLASGGVINWNNGDITLTHASDLLTMAGGDLVVNRSSATAFEVGPNGATDPTFAVVSNVASAASGISITGRAAGSGVSITAISSNSTESIGLIPKGASGRVGIGLNNPFQMLSNTSSNLDDWAGDDVANEGVGWLINVASKYVFGFQQLNSGGHGQNIFCNNANVANKMLAMSNSGADIITFRSNCMIGVGFGGNPSYTLHIAPTSGQTAGQTVFIQDATATTGKTTCVFKGGAVAGNIIEIRNTGNTLNGSITEAGVIDMASYKVGGAAGADFTGTGAAFAALTTVTFVKGILTVAS